MASIRGPSPQCLDPEVQCLYRLAEYGKIPLKLIGILVPYASSREPTDDQIGDRPPQIEKDADLIAVKILPFAAIMLFPISSLHPAERTVPVVYTLVNLNRAWRGRFNSLVDACYHCTGLDRQCTQSTRARPVDGAQPLAPKASVV